MQRLTSHVRTRREQAGLRPLELAQMVGITRQALHSIETGAYVPNTLIALNLARALNCTVEDLFTLEQAQTPAKLLNGAGPGSRVQLAGLGREFLAFPATGLAEQADGLVEADAHGKTHVNLFTNLDVPRRTAILAGCDPSLALLGTHVSRQQPDLRLLLNAVSSLEALRALARGEAHAAGIHLWDARTGESNLPFVQRELPKRPAQLFTLWTWEQGLMVREGNPQGIQGVLDILRPEVRLVNREDGAGSRVLLDAWLDAARITRQAREKISGYAHEVTSPLLAAQTVASGAADVAVGPKSAARACGLDFIPVQTERFDLVVPQEFLTHPAVLALLNVVGQAPFRAELQTLGGYDPSHAGELWKTTA